MDEVVMNVNMLHHSMVLVVVVAQYGNWLLQILTIDGPGR